MNAFRITNQTPFPAYFVLARGQQIIARLSDVAAGASIEVPAQQKFSVVASTILGGNSYTTAPQVFSGASGFLAQVRQQAQHGALNFELISLPSSQANQLQFQKTSLAPVSFILSDAQQELQTVVVSNSFQMTSLNIADTYSIYAVINGVTTDTLSTDNPAATISAVVASSDGYFQLQLN